jgi:hypothetical protein
MFGLNPTSRQRADVLLLRNAGPAETSQKRRLDKVTRLWRYEILKCPFPGSSDANGPSVAPLRLRIFARAAAAASNYVPAHTRPRDRHERNKSLDGLRARFLARGAHRGPAIPPNRPRQSEYQTGIPGLARAGDSARFTRYRASA